MLVRPIYISRDKTLEYGLDDRFGSKCPKYYVVRCVYKHLQIVKYVLLSIGISNILNNSFGVTLTVGRNIKSITQKNQKHL